MSTATHFGTNVRAVRIDAGMTQQQLAWAARVDRSTISAIECGRQKPSIELAKRISILLEVDLDDMVRP
jgi:DNA-binding XRE family transcriptional regulator